MWAIAASSGYQSEASVRHEAISISNEGGYNKGLQLAAQVISDLDPIA
ncbi:hypothetical protein OG589_24465 [Sphaerisporangium sp. NBC_01403]